MEGLQGHINHNSCGEHMSLESLEGERLAECYIYESCMSLDHAEQTPFLPMLLEEQNQQPNPSEPGSFQLLLRLQEEERLRKQQPQHYRPLFSSSCSSSSHWTPEVDACPPPRPLEPESCVTYASETTLSQTRDNDNQHHHEHHHFPSCKRDPTADTTTPAAATRAESTGERTRRKRPRPKARDMEELECQRRAHIAVERNRRKLMNDYLCSLRSLVSPSFIQRGDQASIIGGAIEYVKELEQLLQSLQAEKRMRSAVSTVAEASLFHSFFTSPQYTTYTLPRPSTSTPPSSSTVSSPSSSSSWVMKAEGEAAKGWPGGGAGDSSYAGPMAVADIEATVVHSHVNLKVLSPRRPGQLLRAIAALEDLHLSILHLNITTFDCAVLYSLNLKIEEECKLGSADEIATAVHQILSLVNLQLLTHQ